MASHKIEAFSVNGSHRLRLSPLVKQTPPQLLNEINIDIGNGDDDIFDEEDDDLLKALFRETPQMELNTPLLSISQRSNEFKVIIKSTKLIKNKEEPLPTPPPAPAPAPQRVVKQQTTRRPKMRPKHSHNRHMIHTMPTQPDYLDINQDDDEDIVEALVTLTLIDPVSGTHLKTPLRSRFCSHDECFDYDSFLLMNHLKPFKIVVRRYSNATRYPGDVNVMAILQDSKRPPRSSKEFNKVTVQYDYKFKMKQLGDKKKYFNELNYFCCPICNMEFNINQPGDVYVVGELCDLIQDVKLEDKYEEIENLEINMIQKGQWRWVRKENERKEHIERQIESHAIELVTLDSDDEDFDPETVKPIAEPTPESPPKLITPPIIKEEEEQGQSQSEGQNEHQQQQPNTPVPMSTSTSTSRLPLTTDDVDEVVDDLLNLGEYDAEPGVFMGDIPLPASPDALETQRVNSFNYQDSVATFRPGEYVFTDGQGDVDDPIVLD